MSINSILVVCTGNICRSPLAEALLRRELPQARVTSAGIGALVGNAADANAKKIAEDEGLDVSSHVARQINAEIISEHDLILVMEQGQKEWIAQRFPQAKGRVFLLGHWSNNAEIPDPYRQSISMFQQSYGAICKHLPAWYQRLGQGIH